MVGPALLDEGLGDDARLPGVGVEGGGAVGGDPDLRGRVAAEDGAVLHEAGPSAVSGGGDGGGEAGEATSDDDDVELEFLMQHESAPI